MTTDAPHTTAEMLNEMGSSKFLRKEDFADGDVIVTIDRHVRLAPDELPNNDEKKTKFALYFRELKKGLVLNRATTLTLDAAFGPPPSWAGHKVVVYIDHSVEFMKQRVGGLRLRPYREPKAAPTVLPRPITTAEPFNDEIRYEVRS